MKNLLIGLVLMSLTLGVSAEKTLFNTMSITDAVACTMEFAPVCGKIEVQCITEPCNPVYQTFSNKCVLNTNDLAEYQYNGECKIQVEKKASKGLSSNDEGFYDVIKQRLDNKYQRAVDRVIAQYLNKLEKYKGDKKVKIHNAVVDKIDQKISEFLNKYPQDIELPKKANNLYLTLSLVQFELMKLDVSDPELISWERALEIAKTGNIQDIFQSHSLIVSFSNNDGKKYYTKEPKIDDFIKLVEACGNKCEGIPIATE